MMAAYGILGALMARERTGRGQRVETSLLAADASRSSARTPRAIFENGKMPSRDTRTRSARSSPSSTGDGKPLRRASLLAAEILATG